MHCCIAVACNIAALEIYCKKFLGLGQLGVGSEANVLFIVLFLSFYVQVVSRGSVPVFCEFGAIVSWPVDLQKMF